MSMARECDKCGALFKGQAGVTLTIETLRMDCNDDGSSDSWSEIDFCPKCSEILRSAIGSAINDQTDSANR